MPNTLSKQPGKRYEAGDGRRRRLIEADGPGHKMLGPHKFLDPSRRSLPQPLLGGRRSEERGRLDGERLLLGFATLLRTFVRHGF